MTEKGVKITLSCGHQQSWLAREFNKDLGDQTICWQCERKILYYEEGQPVRELWAWSEITGLEKVWIKTTVEVLPWESAEQNF